MDWVRYFLAATTLVVLAGCAERPAVSPGPALVAPDAHDLLQDKAYAFQAGVAAGERLQARRDASAATAARAALLAKISTPDCPASGLAPAAEAPALTPAPPTAPASTYAPGGPAVPVAPAN